MTFLTVMKAGFTGAMIVFVCFCCVLVETLNRVVADMPNQVDGAIAREANLTRAAVAAQITPAVAKLDSQVTNLRTDLFARVDKIEGDANLQLTAIRTDAIGQIVDTRASLVGEIANTRTPLLALLPPIQNTLDKVSYTSDLMLDCDHNVDCLANRSQGTLKAVEKMAAAGEVTMKVIAETTPETAAAVKSTSKDMATIVHEITKPTTWLKKAAGTAASIIGKFFGM